LGVLRREKKGKKIWTDGEKRLMRARFVKPKNNGQSFSLFFLPSRRTSLYNYYVREMIDWRLYFILFIVRLWEDWYCLINVNCGGRPQNTYYTYIYFESKLQTTNKMAPFCLFLCFAWASLCLLYLSVNLAYAVMQVAFLGWVYKQHLSKTTLFNK
jgi:hypothetical protein